VKRGSPSSFPDEAARALAWTALEHHRCSISRCTRVRSTTAATQSPIIPGRRRRFSIECSFSVQATVITVHEGRDCFRIRRSYPLVRWPNQRCSLPFEAADMCCARPALNRAHANVRGRLTLIKRCGPLETLPSPTSVESCTARNAMRPSQRRSSP
jgi:hypothetical protein